MGVFLRVTIWGDHLREMIKSQKKQKLETRRALAIGRERKGSHLELGKRAPLVVEHKKKFPGNPCVSNE